MERISTEKPTGAALAMVTAMAVVALADIWVARIAEAIGVWQFLFLRTSLSMPIVAAAALCGLGTLRPRRIWAVAARSLLIAAAMFCYFGALGFMPIALALAGLFTSPIFVLLLTAFVLRKRIGPWRIFAVILGFLGILIVLGPSRDALGWMLLLPALGGLLYASGVVATKALCEGESTMTLLFGIFAAQWLLGGTVMLGLTLWPTEALPDMPFLTRGWIWPLGDIWPFIWLQVVGATLGVGLLNLAYQWGEASHVAVFEYTIMIFGPLAAWVFLGQPVSPSAAFGITLIATAGIVIAWRTRGDA